MFILFIIVLPSTTMLADAFLNFVIYIRIDKLLECTITI